MLRRLMIPAVVGVAVTTFAPQGHAAGAANKAITGLYAKEDAALSKKDLEGFLASYSPDFEATDGKGRKAQLAVYRQQLAPIVAFAQSVKAKTTIQKLTDKGNTANATVKTHLDAVVVNPQSQAQKPSHFILDTVLEDTWVKSPKGWLKKQSKSLSSTSTMDGKSRKAGK